MHEEPGHTRAEIARQRLARLMDSFDSQVPTDSAPANARIVADQAVVADDLSDPTPAGPLHLAPHRVTRRQVSAVAAVAAVAGTVLAWYLLAGRGAAEPDGDPVAFTTESSGTGEPGSAKQPAPTIVVDVAGHVVRPGIVTLPTGARVHEALAAAGGLQGQVDTSSINLARVLVDGEQILVGLQPAIAAPGGSSASTVVNLNLADVEALDDLPGVGPVTAQAIIDWRTKNGRFSSVDDLLDVRGIGDATLAELRDLVTV